MEGVNLSGCNLKNAILPYSMEGANLTNANLQNVNLEKVNLTKAILCGTNLHQTDNFSYANAKKAYFWNAQLPEAYWHIAEAQDKTKQFANRLEETNPLKPILLKIAGNKQWLRALEPKELRTLHFYMVGTDKKLKQLAIIQDKYLERYLKKWLMTLEPAIKQVNREKLIQDSLYSHLRLYVAKLINDSYDKIPLEVIKYILSYTKTEVAQYTHSTFFNRPIINKKEIKKWQKKFGDKHELIEDNPQQRIK